METQPFPSLPGVLGKACPPSPGPWRVHTPFQPEMTCKCSVFGSYSLMGEDVVCLRLLIAIFFAMAKKFRKQPWCLSTGNGLMDFGTATRRTTWPPLNKWWDNNNVRTELQKDHQDPTEEEQVGTEGADIYIQTMVTLTACLSTPTAQSSHPRTCEENCREPGTQREDWPCSACPLDDLHLNCVRETKQNNFFLSPFIWKPRTLAAALGCWFYMSGPGLCTVIRFLFYLSTQKPKVLLQRPPRFETMVKRNTFSLQETGPRGRCDRSGLLWTLPSLSVSLPAFWLAFSLFRPVNATDQENSIFLSCGCS